MKLRLLAAALAITTVAAAYAVARPVLVDTFTGNHPGPPNLPGATIEPVPGKALSVEPIPWSTAHRGQDDRTLEITFFSGRPECYGLDRVEVEHAPFEVRVTLMRSRMTTACRDSGHWYRTIVTLAQPLGFRTVVDGSPAR